VITHIVLFKLLNPSPERAAAARKMLLGMAGQIPQLRHLEVGVNMIFTDHSYDLALIARFDSLEDLQAYQNHPVHVDVVCSLQEFRLAAIVVDYQT
jgi:hypothetical protein